MLLLLLKSRILKWNVLLASLLLAVISFSGCRSSIRSKGKSAPSRPTSSGNLHVYVGNRGNSPEIFTVKIDGKTYYQGPATSQRQHAFDATLKPGWHRIESITASGLHHTAMLEADREKWVLINRDPAKPEGVGVHINESPLR
ncbi:MAG: hypothetical protein K1X53_17205 [Candidatus Sumerlaeaceae bacterium]|nr:hypothetical protein [Candidatus Sumerlaeaceae bacterium]